MIHPGEYVHVSRDRCCVITADSAPTDTTLCSDNESNQGHNRPSQRVILYAQLWSLKTRLKPSSSRNKEKTKKRVRNPHQKKDSNLQRSQQRFGAGSGGDSQAVSLRWHTASRVWFKQTVAYVSAQVGDLPICSNCLKLLLANNDEGRINACLTRRGENKRAAPFRRAGEPQRHLLGGHRREREIISNRSYYRLLLVKSSQI